MELKPNRVGKAVEYKSGHQYLTIVEWEDGHCEIEVHQCIPEILFHSCDMSDKEKAIKLFKEKSEEEKDILIENMNARLISEKNLGDL